MVGFLTSSTAPAILIGHTTLCKVLMTVLFRFKATSKATPKAEADKITSTIFYKRVASAQLNEAEYAPLFVAGLCFLALKGVEAPTCSTLACIGQVWYYWLRAFVGHSHEGGIEPPPYAPGAILRYVALAMMALEMYKLA